MSEDNDLSELQDEINTFESEFPEPPSESIPIDSTRSNRDILQLFDEIVNRHNTTESEESPFRHIIMENNLPHISVDDSEGRSIPLPPHNEPVFVEGMTNEEYAEALQRYEYEELQRREIRDIGRAIGFIGRFRRRPRDLYEDLIDLGERLGNVSKGLSKEDLDKIKSKTLSEKPEQETCPVCQEPFIIGQTNVSELICDHLYCTECILPWLKDNKTCPICRTEQPCTNKPIEETTERSEQLDTSNFRILDRFIFRRTEDGYVIEDNNGDDLPPSEYIEDTEEDTEEDIEPIRNVYEDLPEVPDDTINLYDDLEPMINVHDDLPSLVSENISNLDEDLYPIDDSDQ